MGGLIDQDTTWDAALVRVTSSVEVAPTATLTIAAGTRVEFAGFYKLLVHGRLWAVGEPGRRIVFTAAAEQLAEGWDGLEFLNIPAANDSSRLEHCELSNAVARPAEAPTQDRIIGGTARAETGGAVSIVNTGKLAIVSCVFRDNRAEYGAAVYCGYGSSPVLAGNLMVGNTARWRGSAVFNVYAYPKLINNTIVGNVCLEENAYFLCGAVDNFNGKIILLNNIIRDNQTSHYSGTQIVCGKDYYTHANNIQGYQGNVSNLDVDPAFLGDGTHPFQLTEGSLCIGEGWDDDLLGALGLFDVAGSDRVCGGKIDLGAYEFCGTLSPADLTPGLLAQLFLTCAPNPFNPRTAILYDLPTGSVVELEIFDLQGRLVRTLVAAETQEAGRHEAAWNGRSDTGQEVAAGVYLVRLQAGDFLGVRRVTLVK